MEKKTIRSGAPFLIAGVCVMAVALIFGIGGLGGCLIAAATGFLGFAVGKKMFPDQVIEVEIVPKSGNADVDALILEGRTSSDTSFRKAIYTQCLDIIRDWAVEVPVFQRNEFFLFSTERVNVDTITPDITSYWDWMNDLEKLEMNG